MTDAERIAREAYATEFDGEWHPNVNGCVQRATLDAARRGIEFGRSQGTCTAVEREFIEAYVAAHRSEWDTPASRRQSEALNALLAERKPKPKWRVGGLSGNVAIGPYGEERSYFRKDQPDPDTCAREVERLNAEGK